MAFGYWLAIIFAVVWLGFKVFEKYKKNSKKSDTIKKAAETVKNFDTDVDDLIL
ncbi:MAG: hypothetical protein IJT87_13335 [Ruminiclostridium sp.]|nr:hypothetical protein [Ruminiclostridium sp.]